MTHLAFPSGLPRAHSAYSQQAAARVTEDWRCTPHHWSMRLRHALARGLCTPTALRTALADQLPTRALRRLGWQLADGATQGLSRQTPAAPSQWTPDCRTRLSPARREGLALWLRDALQARLVSAQDLRAALIEDEATLALGLATWHRLLQDLTREAHQRGLRPTRDGARLSVVPGWAVDVSGRLNSAVFVSCDDLALTDHVPWVTMSAADRRALLFGIDLINRELAAVFVTGPRDFYGEGGFLSDFRDDILEAHLGRRVPRPTDVPSQALVADYMAECGVNLAEETEAWQDVCRMRAVCRELRTWTAPTAPKCPRAAKRIVNRLCEASSAPVAGWLRAAAAAHAWLAELPIPGIQVDEDIDSERLSWLFPPNATEDESVRIDQFQECVMQRGAEIGGTFLGTNSVDTARRCMIEGLAIACLHPLPRIPHGKP